MRKILVALFASCLAVVLAACGGQAQQPAETPEATEAAGGIVQTTTPSGDIKLGTTAPTTDTITVSVTLDEGEALLSYGEFTTGEVEAVHSHDGEWTTTDYFYEGGAAGEMDYDPGTYELEFSFNEAQGYVVVLAYPAEQIDFENMELEEIIDLLSEYAETAQA